MLLCYDNGKEYSIDLLGAICLMVCAWKQVEPALIRRCFEHAGFSSESTVDADADYPCATLDEEGAEYCDRINALCAEEGESNTVGFAEYLNFESEEQTGNSDLESEITAVMNKRDDSDDSDDDTDEPPRAPALGEVIGSLNVIRSFVECHGGSTEMFHLVGQLESMTFGAANYRTRQTSISDYFQ
ncbi:hypothetical protein V5799_024515 [Amblyomma americanum]|uniref:Uncharacterized protein n=1 Tax=Amblyomma americanum TaxID=6943 RepID=A0AAQ4EBU4_AMBAM